MTTRVTAARFWVDWDFNGAFTDESAYLISASGDMSLSAPGAGLVGGAGMAASMSVTLRNTSGRFSPLRTDGALYTWIRDGKGYHAPCYLEISINGGANYFRVFTGVLKLPDESTLTTQQLGEITLEARSLEEIYLQQRMSTPQATFAASHDAQPTEADVIADYLDAAGVAAITSDAGMFAIDWSWLDDESPIEEVWALAAACGGRVYADPDGTWRYENMAHWQTASRSTTVQATLDRDDYAGLSLRYDDGNLFNVVTVEASPRSVGAIDVIWQPETLPVVQPGATLKLAARFDAPVYAVAGIDFHAADDGGNDRTSSVSVSAVYYAQRADLTIVNSSALRVHLFPLRILGAPVVGAPEVEESRNSADDGQNGAFFATRGTRTKAIRGNPYIQRSTHAATLAQMLLDMSEYPRLVVSVRQALGDPARRLGDRIAIDDAPTMSSSLALLVTRIGWRYGGGGAFRQELEGVSAAQLYRYDGEYFIVGSHAANGTRRLFY